MATTGSLVVRISADINDFSRKLNAMTRDVNKAADKIASVGKAMTLGITLPAALAAAALFKMGAENEQVGRKMQRVFGDSTAAAQANLDALAKIIPETGTELQKMALNLTEVGEGLGFTAQKSLLFSEGVMSMAASISTTKLVPFADAVDAVQKAMLGQTKGLKQLGIVLSETEIKNEGYRLGLIKVGQELNAHGTALASYSLMMQKTSHMTAEAGNIMQDNATKLAFLKRDLSEFADATSNLMVPALTLLVGGLRMIVDGLNALPDWFRTLAITVVAVAAAMGPLIVITTSLIKAFTALRVATGLLMASEGIGGLLAALAAPEVLAALALIAVVVGAGAAAWAKYGKAAKDATGGKVPTPPGVKELLGGAPTSVKTTLDPLAEFQKRAQAVQTGFQQMVDAGKPVATIFSNVVALNHEALDLYDRQKDKLGEVALAAQQVALQTQAIIATKNIADSLYQPAKQLQGSIRQASLQLDTPGRINLGIAGQKLQEEASLRTRESMLRMTDTFNATRVAVLEMGERSREVGRTFDLTVATLKKSWDGLKNIKSSATDGLKAGIANILQEFTPFALAMKAVGAVMQGLQPVIDALFVPLEMFGKILGTIIAPVLKLLFYPLKYLGIAAALVGEVLARVAAGISSGIGHLLVGLGNLINKLPGSPGNGIKRAGQAMLAVSDSLYGTADQLKRQRNELMNLSWDDAVNGVQSLGDAANAAAEALLNLPERFKYSNRRNNATNALTVDRGTVSGPNGDAGSAVNITLMLDGKVLAQSTLSQLRAASQGQLGTPSRFTDIARVA